MYSEVKKELSWTAQLLVSFYLDVEVVATVRESMEIKYKSF